MLIAVSVSYYLWRNENKFGIFFRLYHKESNALGVLRLLYSIAEFYHCHLSGEANSRLPSSCSALGLETADIVVLVIFQIL